LHERFGFTKQGVLSVEKKKFKTKLHKKGGQFKVKEDYEEIDQTKYIQCYSMT
jgi:hypothetical protein